MAPLALEVPFRRWIDLASHRLWLLAEAGRILDFFARHARDPAGGFFELDTGGRPLPATTFPGGVPTRALHLTARAVHGFAIAHLLGRPGADTLVDHGMEFLWTGHRDPVHGGYMWAIGADGPTDATKQAYGHAHVLLAASSAAVVGHPDAERLIADVAMVLRERYWEADFGAVAEEFGRDWRPLGAYRGQNSNMHLCEATMAAFEATGDGEFLAMAKSIAERIILAHAEDAGWHVPEHFDAGWRFDPDYEGDPMFRPAGTTPGHGLEWSRLLAQLWELTGRRDDWMIEAARRLFRRTVADGWDTGKGGFFYTLDREGRPRIRDRYWWPCCEGVAAAAVLGGIDEDPFHETWYRRIWGFTTAHFVDPDEGGWFPQLDDDLKPNAFPFFGKPDMYHSLQACLIPLVPTAGSITRGLATVGIRL
jgi:mannose/cellobiose epimerase-like protein (N-acyl-D-glucosamine 2-epimerase family)